MYMKKKKRYIDIHIFLKILNTQKLELIMNDITDLPYFLLPFEKALIH